MRTVRFLTGSILFVLFLQLSTLCHADLGETTEQEDISDFTFSGSEIIYDASDETVQAVGVQGISADEHINSPSLAATGKLVWRIADGMILCEDIMSGEEEAAYPVSLIYHDSEACVFASIVSRTEEHVLLCLCLRDENSTLRVELMELRQKENAIFSENSQDVTAALGFLFDSSAASNDVCMTACGSNILIEVQNSGFMTGLYLYDFEKQSASCLGEWSSSRYLTGIPCADFILLISANDETDGQLTLSRLSLDDAAVEAVGSVHVGSSMNAANFVCSPDGSLLYYTIGSTVYAVSLLEDHPPEAIGTLSEAPVLSHHGVIAIDRYIVWGEGSSAEGLLLSCPVPDHSA